MTEGPVPTTGASGTAGPTAPAPFPATVETTASTGQGSTTQATKDAAKEGAQHVAHEAAESGRRVAGTAQAEAGRTVEAAKETATATAQEAKAQLSSLYSQTMSELTDQANNQQTKLASGLSRFSDDLESMAGSSSEQGVAADLARRVAEYARQAGQYLDERSPNELIDDVSAYARRHPGTFIAIAAALGVVTGRLARGAKAASSSQAEATELTSYTSEQPSYVPLTGTSTVTGGTVPPLPASASSGTTAGLGTSTLPPTSPGGRPTGGAGGGVLP